MRVTKKSLLLGLCCLFLYVAIFSCATIPELKVNYQLPPKSELLKGKKVFLLLKDVRKVKTILGEGARNEYGAFSGNISFSIARHNETGFKIGIFELSDMIKEGFKRKLETLGAQVSLKPSGEVQELMISLKEFSLDLVKRKWIGKMSYEASIVKEGNPLSTQAISGQAERLKVVGKGAADEVMGELFSDMANRLDVIKLFQQANVQ